MQPCSSPTSFFPSEELDMFSKSLISRWLGGSWLPRSDRNYCRYRRLLNGSINWDYEESELYIRSACGLVYNLRCLGDYFGTVTGAEECARICAHIESEILTVFFGAVETTKKRFNQRVVAAVGSWAGYNVGAVAKIEFLNLEGWYKTCVSVGIISPYQPVEKEIHTSLVRKLYDFNDISVRAIYSTLGYDLAKQLPPVEMVITSLLRALGCALDLPNFAHVDVVAVRKLPSISPEFWPYLSSCSLNEGNGHTETEKRPPEEIRDINQTEDNNSESRDTDEEKDSSSSPPLAVLPPSEDDINVVTPAFTTALNELRAQDEEIDRMLKGLQTIVAAVDLDITHRRVTAPSTLLLFDSVAEDLGRAQDVLSAVKAKILAPSLDSGDINFTGVQDHDISEPFKKDCKLSLRLRLPAPYIATLAGKRIVVSGVNLDDSSKASVVPYTWDDLYISFSNPVKKNCSRCSDIGPYTLTGLKRKAWFTISKTGEFTLPIKVNCGCGNQYGAQILEIVLEYKGMVIVRNQLKVATGVRHNRRGSKQQKEKFPIQVLGWDQLAFKKKTKRCRPNETIFYDHRLIHQVLEDYLPRSCVERSSPRDLQCFRYALENKRTPVLLPSLVKYMLMTRFAEEAPKLRTANLAYASSLSDADKEKLIPDPAIRSYLSRRPLSSQGDVYYSYKTGDHGIYKLGVLKQCAEHETRRE